MKSKLISFILALCLLIAIPLEARYKYNPFTRKLDYYETGADIDLGDLADVTLTGLATGNVLYYNGTAWVNLATGANTNVLTLAGGVPTWAAPGAPAAHAASHEVGGADLVDHDQLTNYLAAQHLTLPNTIVTVLTDHNLAAHTALGLFDASGDVDHDLTTNYVANQHIDWTAASSNFSTTGTITNAMDAAAEQLLISQSSTAHTEDQPLILIDDDRDDEHAVELSEATIIIDADGYYALYIADGMFYIVERSTFAGNVDFNEDVKFDWSDSADRWWMLQTDTTGTDGQPLMYIDDDRTGTYADSTSESTLYIDAAGAYAFYIKTGAVQFDGAFSVLNIFGYDYTTDHNLFFGYLAGEDITAGQGQYNTLVGEEAGKELTTGDYNTIVGTQAGFNFDTESNLTLVGYQAGYQTTTVGLTAIGFETGRVSTGVGNTFVGYQAGETNTSGARNTFIGFDTGQGKVTANDNTGVGYQALYGTGPTGHSNSAFGSQSLWQTTGDRNLAVGFKAGYSNVAATDNTYVGYQSGFFNATGVYNVVIGGEAGYGKIGNSWSNNTIVGFKAGYQLEGNANSNTFVGFKAGYNEKTGSNNTYIGYEAGYCGNPNGGASYNTFVGYQAGYSLIVGGDGNSVFGKKAAYALTTGDGNVVVGEEAGYFNDLGSNNVLLGGFAGRGTSGEDFSHNVVIGYAAGEDLSTGSDNIIIGYYAGEGWVDTEANKFIVANTDTITPLLYGDFVTGDFVSASLTHNSDHTVTGYRRSETINWIDCFDHGSTVAKYPQDWNVAALNTQGNGTNDIDTLPSHITLTTDNNAIGDNEGTRLEETTILRSRQNRSEWSVDLGQTVNTQFYCGWNTSGTNAMVAAADEYVIIFFDHSDNANWQIKVGDGATEDVFTSAVAADTNHVTHEIWVETDGTVHWAINRTEIDITGTVNNLMDAAAHYLIVGQAQSVTGAAVIVAQICHIENEKAKL